MTKASQAAHPSHIVRRIAVSGTASTEHNFILDIFPHRLHPAEGFTREDMILTLLAMLDGIQFRSFYGIHDINQLTMEALDHPYGRYDRGAVLCTPGVDETAQKVHITDGFTIELWDGRSFDLGAFAPASYTPVEARNRDNNVRLLWNMLRDDPILALAVGMLDEMLPLPFKRDIHQGPLEICTQVCARAARLVQTKQNLAGTAGSREGLQRATSLLLRLETLWICPPDRGWAPNMRVKGDEWDNVRTAVSRPLLLAGQEIAKALSDLPQGALTNLAAAEGDDPELSNHQRMGIKSLVKRIDTLIEDQVPVDFLKPAAAKRRTKRAA